MEEKAHDNSAQQQPCHDTTPERVLFVAFALRAKTWKLGCPMGHGQKPRERSIAAGNQAHVLHEVAPANV
jgi:hypothetical protein